MANRDMQATVFVISGKTALLLKVQVELFCRQDLPKFCVLHDFFKVNDPERRRLGALFGPPVYFDHLVPADVIQTTIPGTHTIPELKLDKNQEVWSQAQAYTEHLRQHVWQNQQRNEQIIRVAKLLLDRDQEGFAGQLELNLQMLCVRHSLIVRDGS